MQVELRSELMSPDQAAASADRSNVTGPVAGVVLAAGSSSRMGRNKLLFELGAEPVVRRCVRTALAAGLGPVVVVLGHEAEAVRGALAQLDCLCVVNARFADGMNSSVAAGIAALSPDVAAAILLLADMPLVDPDLIAALVARYRLGDARLILSDYGGVVAPPTLVDRSLFAEFANTAGDGGGKRLRQRYPHESKTVAWSATALADLDLPEDYERVKARLEPT